MDQQTSSVQLPEHLRIDQKYVTKGTVLMSQSLPGWGHPTHPEEICSLLDHPLSIIKYPVWVSPDRALTIPTAPGTGSQEDREGCPSPCPLRTEIHGVTPQPWFPQSALNKSSTTSHRLCLPSCLQGSSARCVPNLLNPLTSVLQTSFSPCVSWPCSSHSWTTWPEGCCEGQHQNPF